MGNILYVQTIFKAEVQTLREPWCTFDMIIQKAIGFSWWITLSLVTLCCQSVFFVVCKNIHDPSFPTPSWLYTAGNMCITIETAYHGCTQYYFFSMWSLLHVHTHTHRSYVYAGIYLPGSHNRLSCDTPISSSNNSSTAVHLSGASHWRSPLTPNRDE